MLSQEYSEAITETLDILEHTNREDVSKISSKFLNFLKENASKTYKPNLDHTKRIKDMQLKQKTIGILTIIYRNFWCTDEQRKEFDNKIRQNEIIYQKELSEIYDSDDLFKNKKHNKIYEETTINTQLTELKPIPWYKKILNKLLNLFGIEN